MMIMIVNCPITPDQISRAEKRVVELPTLNNSITKMAATLHGFVGEELVADLSGAMVVGHYDYDLKLPKSGITLEVKTKRTKVQPKDYYEVSVAKYNTHQTCDYYAFVRVRNDLTEGWFLGVFPCDEYYNQARFLKKGTVDGNNNFVVKADCWNLRINQLQQI